MARRELATLLVFALAFASFSSLQTKDDGIKAEDLEASPPKVELEQKVVPPASTTDHETAAKEKESMRRDRPGQQKFEFQAEVTRLMDIIIHSLYSNKDIFLRELISNASDALDKIRFLSLTDPAVLGEGEVASLDIKIKLDKERRVLTIQDRGVGMTKDDLIKNLGTIAKSGTSSFLEQMQKGGDLNLIGQFGVGFYSVYLVADVVEVISKHNDDKQYVWESKADGAFTVAEDTEGEPLGRGTQINIYLKEEAAEYADEDKLKSLVKRYSEFINFPIYLWSTKEVEKEVPVEEEVEEVVEEKEKKAEEKKEEDKEKKDDDEEEEDEEEEKPKTKTIKEQVSDWELLNDVKAIWLRNPKDVKTEEYENFYKSVSKDWDKPLTWTHFNAEGDVEFKAVLFVPNHAPTDLYDNYYSSKTGLKLYVRRVFISEEFEELLPRYLIFLKGIVDSDTLPLNVSREMLQQHGSLKTIKKKLVRKALDMIRRIAEEDEDDTKKDDSSDEGDDEKKSSNPAMKGKYATFWKEFGKAIKLGIIEDSSNRMRLAKLMRFHTSKSGDKLTSLEEYVSRMKEGQKNIYYLTGENREQLAKSPFVEKLLKKGYEVIYFTDPLDEYVMQNLNEFDDKKFQNASKDDLKMGDKDEKEKQQFKDLKESFKDLTKWWKDALSSDSSVENVKVSNRLHKTPCVVVTSKYGWSANMERIMKAQALSDSEKQSYMRGRKTLEINPYHPIIKELKEKVAKDEKDEGAKESARLMYEAALLESGFMLDDPKEFASRMYSLIKKDLNVVGEVEEPDESEEEEEPEVKKEEEAVPEVKDAPTGETQEKGADSTPATEAPSIEEVVAEQSGKEGGHEEL